MDNRGVLLGPLLTLCTVAVVRCFEGLGGSELAAFCLQSGFSSSLQCSACGALEQFSLQPLVESCNQCCHPDMDLQAKPVYPFAVLEVCECKFGRYPQVQAFVKGDLPRKFRGLEVRYVRGSDPFIKLLNEKRETVETLNIGKWDTDAIVEFLNERLTK